jgi:SAM-dependent methyltransferase
MSNILYKFRRSLSQRGMGSTISLIAGRLGGMPKRAYRSVFPDKRRTATHPFDLKHQAYGIDTSGLLESKDLHSGHENNRQITSYWGTAPSVFKPLMKEWLDSLPSGSTASDYTFIDIGCGKGRALLLATDIPFRSILGVELFAELASVAQSNADKWLKTSRACNDVRVLQADATTFSLPEGPLLVYMYHPFNNPDLMHRVLDRLREHSGRYPVDVAYADTQPQEFKQRGDNSILFEKGIPYSAEDAGVDVGYRTYENGGVYRFRS